MGTLGQCQGSFNFKNGKQNGKKWKNLTMGWFCNSGSILGNSVIPTDLPIWAAEHQEFVSFSADPCNNLIPIGYAAKYRGGGANFDISLPSCHLSTAELSERNQLGQKGKTAPRSNSKGETLSRFQITALPLLFNTLKNVFVPSLLYTYCIPLLCWCIIKVYFFGKRLLCNWVYLAKNPATPPHKGRG